MKQFFKRLFAFVSHVTIITAVIWLSYYVFRAVNQLGLLLRGNLIDIAHPEDIMDKMLTSTSSLGIIFFFVTVLTALIFLGNSEEGTK